MTPRRLIAALLSACAVLAAGCGGTTQRSQSGGIGDAGASLVRSGALAYVAVDSDLSSKQWTQVDDLLKKFPAHDKWIRELTQSMKTNDPSLDYDRDVKPALGSEVDFAVVAARGEKPAAAVLTKPDSMEKARALVKKESAANPEQIVSREVDGWLVASTSQQKIDRVLKGSGGGSLADDKVFKDATESLPTDALAKAYVNGQLLAAYVPSLLGSAQTAVYTGNPLTPLGLENLDWIAAALDAKSDGIRFQAGVNSTGSGQALSSGAAYSSRLISGVPADAFAFATFRGGSFGTQFGKLRQNPQYGAAIRQIEQHLGMRLDAVVALFSHEVAFYVRRGPGLPEFSLVLDEPDTQTALATLGRLAERLALTTHGRVFAEQQDGLTVKSLALGRVTVRWAGFDGRVLLTTAPTGIADYRASGSKLGDDSGFKDALAAADAPDKTSGLLYVDLHDTMQLLQSYFGLSGQKVPADVEANLKPLRSFVAYSTANDDLTKAAAFLQLK